jgi:hypothetical protein
VAVAHQGQGLFWVIRSKHAVGVPVSRVILTRRVASYKPLPFKLPVFGPNRAQNRFEQHSNPSQATTTYLQERWAKILKN